MLKVERLFSTSRPSLKSKYGSGTLDSLISSIHEKSSSFNYGKNSDTHKDNSNGISSIDDLIVDRTMSKKKVNSKNKRNFFYKIREDNDHKGKITTSDYREALRQIYLFNKPVEYGNFTISLATEAIEHQIPLDYKTRGLMSQLVGNSKSFSQSSMFKHILVNNLSIQERFRLTVFEIGRLIDMNHYERAVDLFWETYEYYQKNPSKFVSNSKLLNGTRAYKLLELACERNDEEQVLKLIDILEKNVIEESQNSNDDDDGALKFKGHHEINEHNEMSLNDGNWSSILNEALKNNSYSIIKFIYDTKKVDLGYSIGTLYQMCRICSQNGDFQLCLDIFKRISDKIDNEGYFGDETEMNNNIKRESVIMILQSFLESGGPVVQSWKFLEEFINNDLQLDNSDVSILSSYYFNLDNFENLQELMSTLSNEIMNLKTRNLILYNLFYAIDKSYGLSHLGSLSFIYRFILANNRQNENEAESNESKESDTKVFPLTSDIYKVIFHTLSKSSSGKMISLKIFEDFKSNIYNNISKDIFNDNSFHEIFYNLMRCQLYGTEHDTLYYYLAEYFKILNVNGVDFNSIDSKILQLLELVAKSTDDRKLQTLLSNKDTFLGDIGKLKRLLEFDRINEKFLDEHERTKILHDIIPGFFEYNHEFDSAGYDRITNF
ncbi:hypothetical protein B5S28_g927 [[Candida] boidinii]|nr:hypothetical protein B5S28_g927 [[Candida] boidinii]